jgi:protein SCO1
VRARGEGAASPLCYAALALAAVLWAPRAEAFGKDKHADAPVILQPPVALEEVRVEERLGGQIPLDARFTDWQGRPYRLGQAFDGKRPVVLALVYYDCPMLCGLILSGLSKAMQENGLVLGKDFDAVTVSFDPEERPAQGAERRRGYLQSMGHSDAGEEWPFLVGAEDQSLRVSNAAGFYYRKDPISGEWAHQAVIFVLTPDGKVSRYLYGIEFPPKDLRLALVEAAGGKVGTSFDRLLLTCYRYDPASRKYEPYALGIVRAGAIATLLGLGGLIGVLVWRERKSKARNARQTA